MSTPVRAAAILVAAAASLSTGCSKNAAATSACGSMTDSESCNACCTKNGATGYKYVSGSTCSCLGGDGSKREATSSAAAPTTAATASPASGGELGGTYTIKSSTNPTGAPPYTGTVKIAKDGSVFGLDWTIPNTPPYKGVALLNGSDLAVGWGMGGDFGVVVYEVAGKKLTGTWATGRSNAVGTEDLEGPDNLDGVYKIVKGQGPDGKSYTGTVTIHPTGDTFSVAWKLAHEAYNGVGIKDGNRLVVGWGTGGKGAGVVDYTVQGSTLSGKWATPGSTKLGTEVLGR